MRQMLRWTLVAGLLAGTWRPGAANYAEAADSSPKTVINQKTYFWLLPRFWMAGDKSYALIQIENTFDHSISVYVHCRASDGPISGMTGHHSLRPRQMTTVDSRRVRTGNGPQSAILVNCSMKSHSLATVRVLIQDGRSRNFGDQEIVIRPQVG